MDARRHHLGVAGKPEWDIFENVAPEGESLHLTFDARANEREYTLFIRQDDVKQDWTVTLNSQKLGQLFLMEADLVHTLAIPANDLRDGRNELVIATKTPEDILIRNISIGADSKDKLLNAGPVSVIVRDRGNGQPLPCRLTIVDQNGSLTPINDFGSTNLATRPGVIYTATGGAQFELLPGAYTIFATRGPEYTVASAHILDSRENRPLNLTLDRAADTRGWVAADTHIHTLSLSKHGDATLAERLITIAGEGVELPVSTEHNLHADYATLAREMGLTRYFTVVPGNEVTTKKGHFNILPVELRAKPPDAKLENWRELFEQIRATPKVEIAILNHPTDTHNDFTPFASTNLNLVTGRPLATNLDLNFDAMEVINSGAMRSDWMEPFRAWFALLNRGYKITGVGASDSHDVSRFIVGQGRTYIRVDDSDVAHLDIKKACDALKAGHATVSLGCIAGLTIETDDGKIAGPGDLLSVPNGGWLQISVSVDFPLSPDDTPDGALSRGHAPEARLYANGLQSGAMRPMLPLLSKYFGETTNRLHIHRREKGMLAKPAHDTFYVLIATIDVDPKPEWGLARPYQPTSSVWTPHLIAATNPIWVDADGDGKFTTAREYASTLTQKFGANLPALYSELATYDYYVAAHCAELLEASGQSLDAPGLRRALAAASPEIQRAFRDYQAAEVKR